MRALPRDVRVTIRVGARSEWLLNQRHQFVTAARRACRRATASVHEKATECIRANIQRSDTSFGSFLVGSTAIWGQKTGASPSPPSSSLWSCHPFSSFCLQAWCILLNYIGNRKWGLHSGCWRRRSGMGGASERPRRRALFSWYDRNQYCTKLPPHFCAPKYACGSFKPDISMETGILF